MLKKHGQYEVVDENHKLVQKLFDLTIDIEVSGLEFILARSNEETVLNYHHLTLDESGTSDVELMLFIKNLIAQKAVDAARNVARGIIDFFNEEGVTVVQLYNVGDCVYYYKNIEFSV